MQPNSPSALFAFIEVLTDDDEVDREYLVNYSHPSVKAWLTRMTVWALLNDRSVSMEKATDEDIKTRPLFHPKDDSHAVQSS